MAGEEKAKLKIYWLLFEGTQLIGTWPVLDFKDGPVRLKGRSGSGIGSGEAES